MTRPEFEQIVAMANRESLKRNFIAGSNQVVTNGSTLNIDVFSPSATVSQLLFFSTFWPASATAGTDHRVNLLFTNGLNPVIQMVYTGTQAIRFGNSWFATSPTSTIPNTSNQIQSEYRAITYDNTVGLRLQYINNTGSSVTFTSGHYYEIITLERTISV